jgi:hypothetical protein
VPANDPVAYRLTLAAIGYVKHESVPFFADRIGQIAFIVCALHCLDKFV